MEDEVINGERFCKGGMSLRRSGRDLAWRKVLEEEEMALSGRKSSELRTGTVEDRRKVLEEEEMTVSEGKSSELRKGTVENRRKG
jgi:hypothetical protein